jgi:hypothetical protein
VKAWIGRGHGRYATLVAWVEENIEEMFIFYRLPLAPHRDCNQCRDCILFVRSTSDVEERAVFNTLLDHATGSIQTHEVGTRTDFREI